MSPLDLLGTWRLERRIDDHRAEEVLHLVGSTVLIAAGEHEVDWSERGVLRRPGAAPVEVTRRLRVVRRGEGWWVCFDHGGDFHPWTPGVPVEHPCGADRYRGRLETTPTSWSLTWDVSGPGKDYRSTSRLTRPAQPAQPAWSGGLLGVGVGVAPGALEGEPPGAGGDELVDGVGAPAAG